MGNKLKINIVCGGNSKERDVSIKSGKAVYNAIKDIYDTKLQVIERLIDCATDCDIVFIALHGGFGENGEIQKFLEEKNIPYTGPDSICSKSCFDKLKTLTLLKQNRIPVPDFITNRETPKLFNSDKYILIPRFEGSTIGIQTATKQEINQAIKIFGYQDFIIEKYINGTELTVGYLGDKFLPIIQINYEGDIFGYNAKYSSDKTEYIIPAKIPVKTENNILDYCNKIVDLIRIEHLTRIDLKMDDNGKPYFLEVNTIPGFTERSLVPMAAKYIGISYMETCKILIDSALERDRKMRTL